MSIVIMGDFYQLPPVAARPLYNTEKLADLHETKGQRLYQLFLPTIKMDRIMRQQGDEQAAFRVALSNIRIGKPTISDWQLLTTRIKS
jgi:ATP-dependent DNA helicase PIF1